MPRKCSHCGTTGAILRCSRCKQVYYCNIECQTVDWKSQHKKECKILMLQLNDDKIEKWNPTVNIKGSYIGNGFVDIKIGEFNGIITLFEMQYKFINTDSSNNVDNNYFNSVQFSTLKVNRKTNKFLLRIPQSINDYKLQLRFRAKMYEKEETKDILEWSLFTMSDTLFIPFDAPIHPFQINEEIQFLKHEDELWERGKIINILDGDIAEIEKICNNNDQQNQQNEPQQRWQIALEKLKFPAREQNHIIELLNWMDIYNNLLLSSRNIDCKEMFTSLTVIFRDYLIKERMLEIIFTDFEHDFGYFSRYLSFEILNFLYSDNNNNYYKGIKSINCGLCPEKNHHRAMMKYKDSWSSELNIIYALQKSETIDTSNWDWYQLKTLLVSTMCDICQVMFHHFDYVYLCETSQYNQHAICLPCMNRNVLQNKRLTNILNQLYHIHGLSQDCVLEIVYFVVGWIYSF